MPEARYLVDGHWVDGHWLEAVTVQGRGRHLPTIVMLHEGLGSLAHWKDFPHRLAEETGATVFVYSRHGHGGSDELREPRPVSFMHHEAHVVLPEILRQAGIERPLLFGQSDGASIAILYAGKFPDSPAGLILEAPHVFVEDISIAGVEQVRVSYGETDLPKKLARYHNHPDSLFWGWNNIWLHPDFRTWNIESYLDSIACPVVVIQGEQDPYGTRKQIEAIQSKIPAAEVVILEDCGHAPHRDQPEATLAATVRFLGRI